MAIGLGRLVGRRRRPRTCAGRGWRAGVAEFWRRWHATLTAWLRDYLYVPLGGGRGSSRQRAAVFLASAAWHGWAITKILGYGGFPPRAWRGLLICALLNAAAVVVVHARGRRRRRRAGARRRGSAQRGASAATAVFVALAWLPLLLPQFNRLRDLGAVYLRLFGLR